MLRIIILSLYLSFCFVGIAQLPTEKPHAPDLNASYENGVITLILSDENKLSNNFQQGYSEYDEIIDDVWLFEGYIIYQVQLPFDDLNFNNPDYSRRVAQVDIENDVDQLINWTYDENLEVCIPYEAVNGSNQGLQFEFQIQEDRWYRWDDDGGGWQNNFQVGNTYSYAAIAYATNSNGDNGICEMPSTFIASDSGVNGKGLIHSITINSEIEEEFRIWTSVGQLFLDTDSIEISEFNLYAVNGQIVESFSLNNSSIQSWDISRLSSGLYLAELKTLSGRMTKRIIVL